MLTLLKLHSGTEIIGTVAEDTETTLTLIDPLQINYKILTSQPMPTIGVSRYMPFAETTTFVFCKKQIAHVTSPKPSMAAYYNLALENYRDYIDKSVDDELVSAAGIDDSDPETIADIHRMILERMSSDGPGH